MSALTAPAATSSGDLLPPVFSEWFARRGWTPRAHQLALIEKARDFTLVPWRPELEKYIGRSVSGLMRESGSISWSLGRSRGPSIGM